MNSVAQHIVAITVMLAIAVPAGFLAPRLFAADPLPQLGLGALHKVEIFNTDKCNASLIAYKNSNESIQVNIAVPKGKECAQAIGSELAASATTELQNALDFCVPISSLPDDDPDKLADPKIADSDQKSMFYKGFDLCSSPVKVAIAWNGAEYTLAWKSSNRGRK